MDKKIIVKGMMCVRCQARVEKALMTVPGVTACAVDLASGTASVTLSGDIPDEALLNVIREKGYTPSMAD